MCKAPWQEVSIGNRRKTVVAGSRVGNENGEVGRSLLLAASGGGFVLFLGDFTLKGVGHWAVCFIALLLAYSKRSGNVHSGEDRLWGGGETRGSIWMC